MTEPPEPRRPEEGGGDEHDWAGMEQDAVRDFVADSTPDMQEAIDAARERMGDEAFDEAVAEVLRRASDPMRAYEREDDSLTADEWLDNLEDDALLDSIAQGVRGDLGPDELTELLSELRDRPDDTDIPTPLTARVERGENVLPPRTQEGNTEPMSTQESIVALNTVADSGAAGGPLAEAKATLETDIVPGLMQAVEQLAELRSAAMAATDGTAVASGEVGSAGEHAANAIEDAANAIEDALELVQQAAAGVEQASQHVAAFHSAARSAAERLASS